MAAEPEPFQNVIGPERECVRVIPVGEIDLATAPVLEESPREAIDVGMDRLKVDLSRVSFLDRAGPRVGIGDWSRTVQTQARLDVLHARGQVARSLALNIPDRSPAVGWTAQARITAHRERVVVCDRHEIGSCFSQRERNHELHTTTGRQP